MKEFIDSYSIANTVRMSRSQFPGAIMIVEGSTDSRVYKRFVDYSTCLLVPALGKANATGALRLLEKQQFAGVVAIVDNDFWELDGIKPESESLMVTDTHDLETMILKSSALEKIEDEFLSKKRIARFGITLRELILSVGSPVGFFRWISSGLYKQLSMNFHDLSFEKVIVFNDNGVEVDIEEMVQEVIENSFLSQSVVHEITNTLRELIGRADEYDLWHVCRGHDLIEILTLLIRNRVGNYRAKHISKDEVDGMVRLAFGFREFARTKLYASLVKWEQQNTDYRLFQAI